MLERALATRTFRLKTNRAGGRYRNIPLARWYNDNVNCVVSFVALIFRKEAVTGLPCFASPPSPSRIFRSIHAPRKVWQIYVRRFSMYYHLNKASYLAKTGPNIQIFAKRGETGRRAEIESRTQLVSPASCSPKEFQLLMKLRERIGREFVPMGCWVSTSWHRVPAPPPLSLLLIGRRPNTETRIARQRVCGRIVSPPKFRSTSGPKTRLNERPTRFHSTLFFPIFGKILFQYRVTLETHFFFFFFTKLAVFHLSEQLETELKIFFVALNYVDLNSVYSSTQYSFFLFFTQLGNSNSPGEVT